MPPKKKELTKEQLEKIESLAVIGCNQEEIAAELGICVETLQRFSGIIAQGKRRGHVRARHVLFDQMLKGDVKARIWFGKQAMNERDKIDSDTLNKHEIKHVAALDLDQITDLVKKASLK